MRIVEKSASSEPVTEREMWGRSLDRGFSIIWRVFLAFGSPPSCPGSTLFAFDRDPEHPTHRRRWFVALGQCLASSNDYAHAAAGDRLSAALSGIPLKVV